MMESTINSIDLTNCFLAVVWPTNKDNFDKIVEMIGIDYHIIKIFEYSFKISWDEMIRIIYQDDRVKESSIKFKIETMEGYEKRLYLIYIRVDNPMYRTKHDGRILSVCMEDLKKKLRVRFGGKMTKNNPLHIVDEQSHTINLHEILIKNGEFSNHDRPVRILQKD